MSRPAGPPRPAERLLAAALSHRLFGPDLLGDLAERHAARRRERGDFAADLDYWRVALPLAIRFGPGALGAHVAERLAVPARNGRKEPTMAAGIDSFLFDLRLALRGLAKRPGASLLVVATLAVGLGANAAVFGVIDALVLHPFRFDDSERLVLLSERTHGDDDYVNANLSPASFLELRDESRGTLDALVGFDGWDASLQGSEGPERIPGAYVSPELLGALRARVALGRFFGADEAVAGGERVVVLGHDLWQRRFGGAHDVLGATVEVDGASHRVVGVAPAGFSFPQGAELWAPLVFTPADAARRDLHYLGAFGRLAPGVSLEGARARFELSSRQRAERFPQVERGRTLATRTLAAGLRDPGAPPIFALWQAAGCFVLAIGWLNVANLVLARAQERARELALLDALGAGRFRVVRLQLTEGALFGLAAALLSLPIATVGQKLLKDAIPPAIRRWVVGYEEIGIDWTAVGFTFALAALSVVAVSAWPALRGLRRSAGKLAAVLHEGGRSGSAGVRRQHGRNALIVAEIGAALVLVVAAAISVQVATRLIDGPQGYEPDGLVTFKVALPEERYAELTDRRAFFRGALDRLAELPGVESVAVANVMPATGANTSRAIAVEGEPEPEANAAPEADLRTVSPGYFATLGLPIVAGRELGAADDESALPVAVVSRSFAERTWPGRDPLGRRFRAGAADQPWLTVVGVAGDHLHQWFARRSYPTFFVPVSQVPRAGGTFALRTLRDPADLARELRAALGAVDARLPLDDLRSQRAAIAESTVGLRFVAGVMAVFAVLALVLALSGVYGVMTYRVSLRRQEMGVRVALGATSGDVLRATVGQALRLAAVGLTLGLAASVGVGRLVGAVLRGAGGLEWPVALGAALLLAVAAVGAALLPARRLLALHPADVLRAE